MVLLRAAALCCLCSALVAMAAELIQEQLSLTRRVGETASFSCGGLDLCGDYVGWYQKKETETFTVILDINRDTGEVDSDYNHPQIKDFTAQMNNNNKICELKINKVQSSHSASYYCSCYYRGFIIFGSGTKLYVTDDPVVAPVLTVYPALSLEGQSSLEGRSSLLCVASAMSPPPVQFFWKRQRKEGGHQEELPPAEEGEQLQLREWGRVATIRLVRHDALYAYKYRCYVRHEGGTVEAQVEQEVSALPPPSQFQVRLLVLFYSLLIVKSLVFSSGLFGITVLTNQRRSKHG
ncbi:immunoglobulin kappa light chain-like [Solea solea]|uniref:immunoglobulin kappa light chain-like n=1 Tax=Solea solea TaxID=90069 RepID=UPI00272A8434|nr:immunoglobulin kappa light chain-like [Solea solea]